MSSPSDTGDEVRPDVAAVLKSIGAIPSIAMRRRVAHEHILDRHPTEAAPLLDAVVKLAAVGHLPARAFCEAFASAMIHCCAGGDENTVVAIRAAAHSRGFHFASDVCAVGEAPHKAVPPKARLSDAGVDQDSYFSANPMLLAFGHQPFDPDEPFVGHLAGVDPSRFARAGIYIAGTTPVRVDVLAAHRSPKILQRLLVTPALLSRDVIAMAARRPTKPELVAAIALSDRWYCRRAVREALALNPFSPLWIVLPILTTLPRHLLRRIRDEGAAHERAATFARRLLESQRERKPARVAVEDAPRYAPEDPMVRCSRLDITGAALERLRAHVLEAHAEGRIAVGCLRGAAADVCDESVPLEGLAVPRREPPIEGSPDCEETTWWFDDALLRRAFDEAAASSRSVNALYCFEPKDGAKSSDLPYEPTAARPLRILLADVTKQGAVLLRAFQWTETDGAACWAWTGSLSDRESRTTALSSDLIEAIERAPDDLEGYLLYGDHLHARGDARGELVALQHARVQHPSSEELRKREEQLLGRYPIAGFAADGERKARPSDYRWRLGFLESARLTASTTAGLPPAERARILLTHPSARFLRTLAIAGETSPDLFEAIATHAPSTLQTLVVGDRNSSPGALDGLAALVPPVRILEVHGRCPLLDVHELPLKALKLDASVAPEVLERLRELPMRELESLYFAMRVENVAALDLLVDVLSPGVTPSLRVLAVHAPSPGVLDRELARLLSARNARRLRRIVVYEADDATLVRSGHLAHAREELETLFVGQLARVDAWVRDYALPSFVFTA